VIREVPSVGKKGGGNYEPEVSNSGGRGEEGKKGGNTTRPMEAPLQYRPTGKNKKNIWAVSGQSPVRPILGKGQGPQGIRKLPEGIRRPLPDQKKEM